MPCEGPAAAIVSVISLSAFYRISELLDAESQNFFLRQTALECI
jgi:hypothetical protein